MFRLTSTRGSLTLDNDETRSSYMVGRLTSELISIIGLDGYVFDYDREDAIDPRKDWSVTLTKETAKKIYDTAMTIKKPKRDQSKKKSEQPAKKVIDAMDVMLGLAKY